MKAAKILFRVLIILLALWWGWYIKNHPESAPNETWAEQNDS